MKTVKVEVLFPEFCNLFGDLANITYLKKCVPEAEIIETQINEEPKFISEKIDLVYLGPMTERIQEKVIEKLLSYKNQILKKIEENMIFLITGNALEIFGEYIENEDGSKIEGMNIFNIHSKRDMMHRYNTLFLGKFDKMKIVGYKNQFSMLYGDNSNNYFVKSIRGIGLNKESDLEGIRVNNFFGTSLLGPILILNPDFTKYMLELMGIKNPKLAFEEDAYMAYNKRLEEFEDVNRKIQ